MAQTVDEAFRQFHGMLTPTHEESQAAKNHRASIEACLKKNFGTTRFFPTGSFENGTSIRGYSDGDYFACVPTENLAENSFTVLQDIREVLTDAFRGTKIDIRPPAVRVCFRTVVCPPIEIVPADFIGRDKQGNHIYEIADSDGAGGWIRSSPDAHNNYVDEVDGEFGGDGEVKRLVRLLKAWKYYCDVPIKSFYLEIFVTKHVSQKNSIVYSKDVRSILAVLWNNRLSALEDPKGISGSIQPCSSNEQKADALQKLHIALERAQKAREAEKRGDISGAFASWNDVYNKRFLK